MAAGRLFAYGTLEIPELVRALLGRELAGEPARLEGWERFLLRGREYPGVVARPGACTPGVLYGGLDARAFALLDRFEGTRYERRELPVRSEEGAVLAAQVYVIPEAGRHLLGRLPWDRDRFAADSLAEWLSLCERLRRSQPEPFG
jgi:gamma-glutamylcyclotransferase (GGCT)/AIG2-like uncharacterized protein YtfP